MMEILGHTDTGLEIVRCALCEGTKTRRYYTKFGYRIARCTKCGFVFANPRMTAEQTEQRYSATYFRDEYLPSVMPPNGPDDGQFLDDRYRPSIALLARSGVNRGRLVEIGTGAGFFLKAAARAGWDAHGLELSPEASAYARDTLGLRVLQTAAEVMPYDAGYFDAAAMFEVIEHLRDPLGVLRAARRAVRKGGVMVISTPNVDALSHRIMGKDWAVISPAEHLYCFSERTLGAMLFKAGFSRVDFIREFEPWLLYETMNVRYTHAPNAWRSRLFKWWVETHWAQDYREVQRLGLADTLLAAATV
jgi:SAM-dependent methyltransferase